MSTAQTRQLGNPSVVTEGGVINARRACQVAAP